MSQLRSVLEKFEQEQKEREVIEREIHQKEREVLFENETLVIKVLQAVAGGSLLGSLSQADTLVRLAGRLSFFSLLTAMGLALIAAVLAAYWKHQYKMWDVKARVCDDEGESKRRIKRTAIYLNGMRRAMWIALILIAVGFAQLLAFLWAVGFRATPGIGIDM